MRFQVNCEHICIKPSVHAAATVSESSETSRVRRRKPWTHVHVNRLEPSEGASETCLKHVVHGPSEKIRGIFQGNSGNFPRDNCPEKIRGMFRKIPREKFRGFSRTNTCQKPSGELSETVDCNVGNRLFTRLKHVVHAEFTQTKPSVHPSEICRPRQAQPPQLKYVATSSRLSGRWLEL